MNLRSLTTTDLQSAAFDRSAIFSVYNIIMRSFIFKYKKNNNIILNNIKKDLKRNTFFFDKQTKNKKLNLIFPLYSPKISFFKVSGLFRKNMKQNGINQSISIQSFVSKNKVIFNLSPSVPFVYIF